jgi:Xaa-Pro dipeptidase
VRTAFARLQRRLSQLVHQHFEQHPLIAITPGVEFEYLVGTSPVADERPTYLLIAPERAALVVPRLNQEALTPLVGKSARTWAWGDAEGPLPALKEALSWLAEANRDRGRIYFSDGGRYDHFRVLSQVSPYARTEFALASELLAPLRLCKTADEQEFLARSAAACDLGMQAGLAALRPGVSERAVAEAIRAAFMAAGADREAFILVAFGPNSAHPHHQPGDTPLTEGPVLLDIGCYRDGYASDMTRMAYLGEPSLEFREVFSTVEQALQAGLEAVRPGNPCGFVDRAARRLIAERGFGDRFIHRTGHGIGIEVHEAPSIVEGNDTPIAPGMAFSIEPGIYLPGRFGVRLEEIVLVEEQGPRILSRLPRGLYRVPM